MKNKAKVIGIVVAVALPVLLLTTILTGSNMGILSKKSKAERLWKTSGHANKDSVAFTYWNNASPQEIPTTCAKCHSTHGFKDFLGVDGSAVDVVDKTSVIGTTVECEACHTDKESGALRDRTSVKFPSATTAKNLGPEALCMECHQGRASTVSVNDHIKLAAAATDDTVSRSLRFQNIHYYAAAANQFGTIAKGGYEYTGKTYDARFPHITGYNACNTCHNPHSLKVDMNTCNTCHTGIKDPRDIRYFGSWEDYDGDGDIREGIYYEINGFQAKLYDAIKQYARLVSGTPIVYEEKTHPFFYRDTNGNGVADSDEVTSANAYAAFTPRLLRAAYNFQVSKKDPAAYAHGGKYIIELLFDSLEDLNGKIDNYINLAALARTDEGHFDGSSRAWRNWDATGVVPITCAKCHTAEGLPYLLTKGTIDKEFGASNAMLCTTCHTSPPAMRRVGPVTFPSGSIKDMGDTSNICLHCHQGRASKVSVDTAISGSAGPYSFINIHYYPAAAIFFGSEVRGGYEFTGKKYAGQKLFANHNGRFDTCVECHMGTKSFNRKLDASDDLFHNLVQPNPADCVLCHGHDVSQPNPGADPAKFEVSGIRPGTVPDYDGDGNIRESLQSEIKGLEKLLYAQIQAYGFSIGSPIVYDPNVHPYFFRDRNGNGLVDPGEATSANRYSFTALHLRAAYNYQVSKKDPCGYIHNSRYIAQLLVDSIEHLGGSVSTFTWR